MNYSILRNEQSNASLNQDLAINARLAPGGLRPDTQRGFGHSSYVSSLHAMADLTNLELFVLAMIQTGLGTPYDLKVKAGLSLGSTIPLLARMEKAHLVQGAKAGAHNSRRFTITPLGTKLLKAASWEELGAEVSDVDSALRIAYLAWRFANRRKATRVLQAVGGRLKAGSSTRRSEAVHLSASLGSGSPTPDAHRWMRLSYEASRLAADAEVLATLARDLEKRASAKDNGRSFSNLRSSSHRRLCQPICIDSLCDRFGTGRKNFLNPRRPVPLETACIHATLKMRPRVLTSGTSHGRNNGLVPEPVHLVSYS